MLAYCLILPVFSLLSTLPYYLISLILLAISNGSPSRSNLLFNYSVITAICWLFIGIIFGREAFSDNPWVGLGAFVIFGLGGAGGGWVIGQLQDFKPKLA